MEKQLWAYQAHLAGHTTGESFGRAAAVLKLAAASTPANAAESLRASR